MINAEMGALLWRRVYEAECNLDVVVPPMQARTLRALLNQAELPEPEDDLVFWRVGDRNHLAHGRTRTLIDCGLEDRHPPALER